MRNIFLITVDDLCADHVGHLGYKKDITPNFDSFSKQNISFTQAVATGPRTTLSFPSILFSLYASEYFNQKKYGSKDNLASFFKKIGYKTAAFNSNPHFRMWGFSKGFEYFEDFLYKTGSARNKTAEKLKRKIVKTVGRKSFIVKKLSKILTHLSPDIALPYADAETINNQSLKWIREQKNQPVFCWIHYMDPHYPFIPPKEYIDIDVTKKDILTANRLHKIAENYKEIIPEEDIKTLISLYDGEIRYLDRYIGDFLNRLKNMGLYDDSVIVFTADHGELFGDYGFFGHRYDVLYQKQLHVPLIIKTPKNEKKTIEQPVSLIDVPFTIAGMLNLDSSVFNGGHLWKRKREYIISEGFKWKAFDSKEGQIKKNNMMISCQKDNWKLIVDGIHDRKELYNLDDDPEESTNLYDGEKNIASELEEAIRDHRNKMKPSEKAMLQQSVQTLKKAGKV